MTLVQRSELKILTWKIWAKFNTWGVTIFEPYKYVNRFKGSEIVYTSKITSTWHGLTKFSWARLKSCWILVDYGGLLAQRGTGSPRWETVLGSARVGMIGMEFPPIFISNLEEKKLPKKRGQPEKSPGSRMMSSLHTSTALIELSLHSYVWFIATSLGSHFEGPPTIQLSKEPIGPISEPMRAITGKASDACAEQPAS